VTVGRGAGSPPASPPAGRAGGLGIRAAISGSSGSRRRWQPAPLVGRVDGAVARGLGDRVQQLLGLADPDHHPRNVASIALGDDLSPKRLRRLPHPLIPPDDAADKTSPGYRPSARSWSFTAGERCRMSSAGQEQLARPVTRAVVGMVLSRELRTVNSDKLCVRSGRATGQ